MARRKGRRPRRGERPRRGAISPRGGRDHWEPVHEIRYNEKNMGWIKERAFMQR